MSGYILMIVVVLASGGTNVSTQDFDSREACEAVKQRLEYEEMMDRIRAAGNSEEMAYKYRLTCVKK